ncbi:Bromodomain containing protein [Trichomonas vaginalis G3]|uniref:Bromodomain containing protein n=1 Tax=Trichomonas vaginalis (strain ATCC PRA-98 / G3) TaxID=412133 RepID=A2FR76_TRIV3|nr:negative regulation of protein autoubiquitination [Trichomonas vaginalis G3]EAX92592.1 Bromodomain containing protein [Trichomonas vaginalis G3]KAI5533835.1 negative regulation of protein autoubiquitination [Trichomonas vaginalis G3]|eukprot:XP_001305522.1 Bromodomain containing protein [Trichomonas vaginalis G3]
MNDFDQKWCTDMINKIRSWPIAIPFLEKVDPEDLPDYKQVVSKPMDISTMKSKLEKKKYTSINDFFKDLQLIHDNSSLYNGPTHMLTHMAKDLLMDVHQRYAIRAENEKDSWLFKLAQLRNRINELIKNTPPEFLQDSKGKNLSLPNNFYPDQLDDQQRAKMEMIVGETDLNVIPKNWVLYTTKTKEDVIKVIKKNM